MLAEATEEASQLKRENQRLLDEIEALKRQIKQALDKQNELKSSGLNQTKKLQDELEALRKETLELQLLPHRLQEAQNLNDQLNKEQQTLKDQYSKQEKDLKNFQNQLASENIERQRLQKEIQHLNEQISRISKESDQRNADNESLRSENKRLNILAAKLEQQKSGFDSDMARQNQMIESLKSRLDSANNELEKGRPLMLKCPELEARVLQQQKTIDNLSDKLALRDAEINELMSKLQEKGISLISLQDLPNKLASLQKEHKDLMAEYNQTRTQIQEVMNLIQSKAAGSNDILQRNFKECDLRNQELENKLALLSQEIERLQRSLEQERQEKIEIQRRQAQTDQELAKLPILDSHNKALLQQIENLQKELIATEMQLNDAKRNGAQIKPLESQIDQLKAQHGHLTDVMNNTEQQLKEWRKKANDQEFEIQRLRQLEPNLMQCTQSIESLQRDLSQANNQIEKERQENNKWRNRNAELEINIEIMQKKMKQNEQRFEDYLREKEATDRLLQQIWLNNFRQRNNDYDAVKNQLQNIILDTTKQQQQLRENEINIQDYERKIRSLETIINQLQKEKDDLKSKDGERFKLETSLGMLNSELDRLQREIELLRQENSQLKQHYIENDSLVQRLNENLVLCVLLFAEIESLRERMKAKENECEEIRRSSLEPFKRNVIRW